MWYLLICSVFSFFLGMIFLDYLSSKDTEKVEKEYKKILLYYHILNMWLYLKQRRDPECLHEYMDRAGYHRVAIYGMKELGERLYDEIRKFDNIALECVIDTNKNIAGDYKLISPEEEIPEVDVIIVTPEYYFNEIKEKLERKVSCPIVSLNGLLGIAYGINL